MLPRLALISCCLVAAGSAFAGQKVTETPISDWPKKAAALGAACFDAQNAYYTMDDSDDWKSDLIPLVLYNGRYIYFRGPAAGIHAVNGDAFELNLLARARLPGLDPGQNAFLEGLEAREERFRWGFGFGLSYAAKIPITEQREQTKEGKNTSHRLSCMEMQLDVPLRRFIKAQPVRNCFAGVTIVHRSGIFGRSDLLGDVSGGSDWITLHLECARL